MIELISESRCTGCNICVRICPVNVFDAVPDAIPLAARKSDCQTCFLCEVYCPYDALYVAPDADNDVQVDEKDLVQRGLLGSYRRAIGWTPDTRDRRAVDHMFKLTSVENGR
jgi:NAD-dependent dihydropyrimidine dehydrogenase PreA subunit